MTLMARAAAFLNRTLSSAAGVEVVYQRVAGGLPIPGTAWLGSEFNDANRQQGATQVRLPTTERVYLVPAVLIGEPPVKGDRIAEVIGGATCTYEVMPSAAGPEWVWSDTGRTRYRVRTKRVS